MGDRSDALDCSRFRLEADMVKSGDAASNKKMKSCGVVTSFCTKGGLDP